MTVKGGLKFNFGTESWTESHSLRVGSAQEAMTRLEAIARKRLDLLPPQCTLHTLKVSGLPGRKAGWRGNATWSSQIWTVFNLRYQNNKGEHARAFLRFGKSSVLADAALRDYGTTIIQFCSMFHDKDVPIQQVLCTSIGPRRLGIRRKRKPKLASTT